MSVINGLPLGAKFLADSIMADVIDYDELLTGSRSEATYTMFKGSPVCSATGAPSSRSNQAKPPFGS